MTFLNPEAEKLTGWQRQEALHQEVAIEDSAAPVFNQEGRLIGVVLVFHNVTDKRRMEKELQRSRDRLYDRGKELEQFHDAVVGRELKMIELEKDNARLRAKLA